MHFTKKGQPYIILKDGKARFVKKNRAIRVRAARINKPKKHKRVVAMAKKHYYRKSGMGLKTLAKAAIIGVGAYYLTENNVISAAAGYFLGGVPAALAGFVAPTIKQYIPKV